ncbi:hypothetical protein Esti_001695 [Eimeria stiedai]
MPPLPADQLLSGASSPDLSRSEVFFAEFASDGTLKQPDGSGNFRVKKGSVVLLRVYEGTQQRPVTGCSAIDPLGEEVLLESSQDVLGHQTFVFPANIPGPYRLRLCFEQSGASDEESTTASSPTDRRMHGALSACSAGETEKEEAHSTIIVEPVLCINGETLGAEGLSVQTVLSRCLGDVKHWWRMFQHTKDMGYNMVHFTPLQATGESGSCYSLARQLEVDPFFFGEEGERGSSKSQAKPEGLKAVADAVGMLEHELGILSATDIVLNHTASNTEWIREHPEAGYNLENAPHLRGAFALDCALQAFSLSLAEGGLQQRFGCGAHINNEEDLRRVMHALEEVVLKPFHFESWFKFDVGPLLAGWRQEICKPNTAKQQAHLQYNTAEQRKARLFYTALCHSGVSRDRPVEVPIPFLCALYPAIHFESEVLAALEETKERLVNTARDAHANTRMAIEGLVRYERLVCRRGPIGRDHWSALIPRYFTVVEPKGSSSSGNNESQKTPGEAAAQAAAKSDAIALANNGWVMNWDATKDFAAPGSLVYLRRELVVWSDCIKLRYGSGPEDSPFLWDLMSRYCRNTAEVFHAVRLDNCHSTPLHVAEHMLRECRRARPDLWVYAELFTGKQETDLQFERHLGLNALIREAMQTANAGDLVWQLKQFGGREAVGSLDPRPAFLQLPSAAAAAAAAATIKPAAAAAAGGAAAAASPLAGLPERFRGSAVRPLQAQLCPALFYDCTHDNEPPSQKFSTAAALPLAALAAAAAAACGSTRGTDELIPYTLSVVHEKRLYHDFHPETPLRDPSAAAGGGDGEWGAAAADGEAATDAKEEDKDSVVITWTGGGSRVVLRGEWDGWAEDVEMERSPEGFRCTLTSEKHFQRKRGDSCTQSETVQYKYIVDGQWTLDESKPTEQDEHGNRNNLAALPGAQPRFAASGLPGLLGVRPVLNALHVRLAAEGFSQFSAETRTEDLVVVVRANPHTLQCCYVIARCAYTWDAGDGHLPEIQMSGKITEVSLVASLHVDRSVRDRFQQDPQHINGLPGACRVHAGLHAVANSSYSPDTGLTTLRFHNFPRGSVAVLFTAPENTELLQVLQRQLRDTIARTPSLLSAATTADLNCLLYRCHQEETDVTAGARGAYDVPGYGPLVYCGLTGIVVVFDKARSLLPRDQLRHPICTNVQAGLWLLQYTVERLTEPTLLPLQQQLQAMLLLLQQHKGYDWVRPYICDRLFSGVYAQVGTLLLSRLPTAATTAAAAAADPLLLHLLTATVQFYGRVPSAPLIWGTHDPSLAAGLPHFTTGFMRNWGRDTFIALNGNLIFTGRFDEARAEILGYARVLRHGLIPNLLDCGNNPRYNARDATWFFMQAVQDYCMKSPEGLEFLLTAVEMKYGQHASQLPEYPIKTMADVLHHILASHAKGISFREWNAGRQLDEQMQDKGFNIEIHAGNKGQPATPRDGAAVEIIGLLKSALRFVTHLPEEVFPYSSVVMENKTELLYTRWEALLEARFERFFYVPLDPKEDSEYFLDSKLVNRRGIYKDTHRASAPWADYQLRPNACVALAVAPELFHQASPNPRFSAFSNLLGFREHARAYLNAVESLLYGPKQLGLKTLDPGDLNYRPDYDNGNDGLDKSVAHGWNYHQGPEWVWPLGYYLEARRLFFDSSRSLAKGSAVTSDSGVSAAARRCCLQQLSQHREYITSDVWRSLPELTNHSGT